MRTWQRYVWIALAVLLAGGATPVRAQRETMGDPDTALSYQRTGYPRPDRKRTSFWSRPAAETVEAQWQQAQAHADAGRAQLCKPGDGLGRRLFGVVTLQRAVDVQQYRIDAQLAQAFRR